MAVQRSKNGIAKILKWQRYKVNLLGKDVKAQQYAKVIEG